MAIQIIAIGGGAISKNSVNFPIENYLLEQTKKETPKVCLLATATGDASHNLVRFYDVFSRFNCKPSHLSLFEVSKNIERYLLDQDLIYVGGGNTKTLLAIWREWEVDKILNKAYQNGTVLSGFSAGSICWFEEGLSDYISTELNLIKALGFLKGSHCPHFDSESKRKSRYCELIGSGLMKDGIAADDDVALHYIDGELFKVVSSNPNGKGYKISKTGNGFEESELIPNLYL